VFSQRLMESLDMPGTMATFLGGINYQSQSAHVVQDIPWGWTSPVRWGRVGSPKMLGEQGHGERERPSMKGSGHTAAHAVLGIRGLGKNPTLLLEQPSPVVWTDAGDGAGVSGGRCGWCGARCSATRVPRCGCRTCGVPCLPGSPTLRRCSSGCPARRSCTRFHGRSATVTFPVRARARG